MCYYLQVPSATCTYKLIVKKARLFTERDQMHALLTFNVNASAKNYIGCLYQRHVRFR